MLFAHGCDWLVILYQSGYKYYISLFFCVGMQLIGFSAFLFFPRNCFLHPHIATSSNTTNSGGQTSNITTYFVPALGMISAVLTLTAAIIGASKCYQRCCTSIGERRTDTNRGYRPLQGNYRKALPSVHSRTMVPFWMPFSSFVRMCN